MTGDTTVESLSALGSDELNAWPINVISLLAPEPDVAEAEELYGRNEIFLAEPGHGTRLASCRNDDVVEELTRDLRVAAVFDHTTIGSSRDKFVARGVDRATRSRLLRRRRYDRICRGR